MTQSLSERRILKTPLPSLTVQKANASGRIFVIVSNEEQGKWIICIETQAGNDKSEGHIIAQLKGAQCFIGYCKCYRHLVLGICRIS